MLRSKISLHVEPKKIKIDMIFISLVVLIVVLYSCEYHNYQVSSKIQQYMQTDQKSTENCISKQNYFF